MAASIFEGISIVKHRVVTLRYQIDGEWDAIPVLTVSDFKKENIIDREFQKKGWFYESCMRCTCREKEKWPEMNARLVFADISHIEINPWR